VSIGRSAAAIGHFGELRNGAQSCCGLFHSTVFALGLRDPSREPRRSPRYRGPDDSIAVKTGNFDSAGSSIAGANGDHELAIRSREERFDDQDPLSYARTGRIASGAIATSACGAGGTRIATGSDRARDHDSRQCAARVVAP